MKNSDIQSILAASLVAAVVCAPAQSFLDVADASLDAIREGREQNAAPANVRAIFAKAKAAADEDNKLNLCGFYTGMSEADAQTLVGHYALKDGEWLIEGDPVYRIHFSLKGIRRVTKGGNTFDDLAQAVANRVGSLKQDWETKAYSLETIDGIFVTMSKSSGFTMVDAEAKADAERKAREEREAAKRKAYEEQEAAKRKAYAEQEAAARKAYAERAAERRAREEARKVALDWKGKSKSVSLSGSVVIELRSVPGNLWFGQYEVTQAQWEAVMGENPSRFKGANNPVEEVSWDDCQEFLKKLNALPSVKKNGLTFRLPTDAEWEAACRAGATGKYCLLADGTEITEDTLGRVAWFKDNADSKTHPVGQKKPNAFGLYDMHGNVWEWCQEELETVASWAKGKSYEHDRVFRGGCWLGSAGYCESSNRDGVSPSNRFIHLGFRVCASGRAD